MCFQSFLGAFEAAVKEQADLRAGVSIGMCNTMVWYDGDGDE